MINNDLINYVQSQQSQGKSNELIKNQLLTTGWSEVDVDQAINQTSEKKVKVITIIAELLFLIAGIYTISAIKPLGLIFILQKTFLTSIVVNPFLKLQQIFCLMSLISALASLIFFYTGFKVADRSKSSFFLIVISLISIPLIHYFLNVFIFSLLNKEILNIAPENSGVIKNFGLMGSNQYQIWSINPFLVISVLIALVLTIISFKKFNLVKKKISTKFKRILIAFILILTIPNIYFMTSAFIKAKDTDFAYSDVQAQVNYHVYKPSPIPTNLVNATKFYLDEEEWAGKNNAIRVTYDLPIKTQIESQSQPIVCRQVGVEANFDLNSFFQTAYENLDYEFTLPLTTALHKTAYYFQKPFGETTIQRITFLTSDHVLIEVSALKTEFDQLVEFASSLK